MGSAAAPGDAGEALVGQTSSSGVRLSDSSSCFFRHAPVAAATTRGNGNHGSRPLARPFAFACNSPPSSEPFLTHRRALFSYTR
ncbi:hypothetical protein CIC12_00845 [Burkholderia sp. SG-MS1]|nr:hypothetical protein [Paraburkholderia sp. SG-MS1]